ncbi:MAG: thioredoxin family protein, partial [Muribaculaceae bacterium]|nr:thioredoxin family protein [Muribaculaceae bacterium]
YVRILKSALANKKFPKLKRARYELQLKQLEHSMTGEAPNIFEFTRSNGESARYFPMSTPTIIIFGDPECGDCRMAKLRMQANVAFSKAVSDGKINVLFIIPDPEDGWEKMAEDFPANWTVGASDSVSDIYDIRDIPEVYVIGSDGKIAAKHITTMQAMNRSMSLINE